ncbi:substrate-binding domain-containing protein [Pseudahrensia aquimaris]|uniref:Substrate-binding domain-containing protein n=1 Tax=Pseudahrensia aquimaris TaxID=744461 RepID=A0ABW3F9U0_9HYPH
MTKSGTNLKKLSQHLGLSQTTVSRALNGFPEVNEKTRERVRMAARELNYQPNPSAASLATGKARQIGHVIPLSDHTMINPHFSDFIAGAGEAYARLGYDMLLRVVAQRDEHEVYRDFANRRRVDAVVVHGPLRGDGRIDLLQQLELPFLVHGRDGRDEASYSWLDVDNAGSFRDATTFLIERGHHDIALVNGLETMNFAHQRMQGYRAALQEGNIDPRRDLLHSADMVEPYGYHATHELLGLSKPPSAIIYSSILVAMGGARALSEIGCKIGSDIAVIIYDDALSFLASAGEETSPNAPFFTSMRSSIRDAGRRAAEMLIKSIDHGSADHVHELWEPEFVLGASTGDAP